jgi:methionine salvage enolase-phosphatase E1
VKIEYYAKSYMYADSLAGQKKRKEKDIKCFIISSYSMFCLAQNLAKKKNETNKKM